MNREELIRGIGKRLLAPAAEGTPVNLDMLNSTLVVCLGAYVIALGGKPQDISPEGVFTFDYWLMLADTRASIYLRDLVYDLLYPATPKDLREAVDILSDNETSPGVITSLVRELFSWRPDKEDIRAITEYVITRCYPLIVMEAIDTPQSINRLCMEILRPTNGTFYDGVSGVGSTYLAAGKFSKDAGGELSIYAQDKLNVLCAVSVVRAYINEIGRVFVQSGDVLAAPGFTKNGRVTQFDYSVMFPPLGQSWENIAFAVANDAYSRFCWWDVPKSNAEWLFVQHQIASLKEGSGRGIIAVSTGALFNAASKSIRRKVLQKNNIECIITLPSKILPYTTIPLSLLVLNKGRTPLDAGAGILMIQTETLFRHTTANRVAKQMDDEIIQKIVSMVEAPENGAYSRMVRVEEITANDGILLPSRYVRNSEMDTEFGTLQIDFDAMRQWPSLHTVSEVYRGVNISRPGSGAPAGNYRVINYADVQDGRLITENLKWCAVAGDVKRYMVRPGDLLISCKGPQIKICIVPDHVGEALLSINFIGVRLREGAYSPAFLLEYLNSPAGQAYLKGRQIGTSIITLKNQDLEEMPIPMLPLEEQLACISEFASIQRDIEERVRRLYHHLRQEKWKLFENMGLDGVLQRKDAE